MRAPLIVPLAIGFAAGQERRPHVDVGGQVLDVGHVAVLAEEGRAGDERARRLRVELVGRVAEGDDVTGPGRVRHVGGRARAVRDVAGLGLGVDAVDDLPALGLAVAGPVVGVGQRLEGRLDLRDRRRLVDGRDLLEAAAGRIAPGEVEVDLDGAAGPAGLGLADRLAAWPVGSWRSAAWTAGRGRRGPCWRRRRGTAARSRGRTRRRSSGRGPSACARARGCRRPPGRPASRNASRCATRPSGVPFDLDVVVGRVRCAAGQLRRDEAEELVLELVGGRVADQRQVRLVGLQDVLDAAAWPTSPSRGPARRRSPR